MTKNFIAFYLVTVVIFVKSTSIIKRTLFSTDACHTIPDMYIFIISVITLVVLCVSYKHKLIRYSFIFLFLAYFLENLSLLIAFGSKPQLIINIIELCLLSSAFIYALKYKKMKIEDNSLISAHPYRELLLIIVAVILLAIIFVWYSQLSVR